MGDGEGKGREGASTWSMVNNCYCNKKYVYNYFRIVKKKKKEREEEIGKKVSFKLYYY